MITILPMFSSDNKAWFSPVKNQTISFTYGKKRSEFDSEGEYYISNTRRFICINDETLQALRAAAFNSDAAFNRFVNKHGVRFHCMESAKQAIADYNRDGTYLRNNIARADWKSAATKAKLSD